MSCQLALDGGMAASTAGGTHHAFSSYGSGFCLLNDLAIAARWAISTSRASRLLIVDLDVHQVSLGSIVIVLVRVLTVR